MPDCSAVYLLEYLFEIRPIISGEPITHTELHHWQQNVGIRLTSWETRTLHFLSRDYFEQARASQSPDCPAPWNPEEHAQILRALKAQSLKENLRSLAV